MILLVWFDSGSTHFVLERDDLKLHCPMYLEGSDQYRGCFTFHAPVLWH